MKTPPKRFNLKKAHSKRLFLKKSSTTKKANSESESNKTNINKILFTSAEAAEILGVAKGTLPVWRHKGKGPKYLKIEYSVKYRIDDLIDYMNKNTITPQ